MATRSDADAAIAARGVKADPEAKGAPVYSQMVGGIGSMIRNPATKETLHGQDRR
jgi:hypothetical protein